MSVFRIQKTKNYTVMSNYHLRDKNLSLKAKGLLSLMLSLPEDWDYSIGGLASICKENKTAVTTALKELKTYGYLITTKLNPNETPTGRIDYAYDIFETPQDAEQFRTGRAAVEESAPAEAEESESASDDEFADLVGTNIVGSNTESESQISKKQIAENLISVIPTQLNIDNKYIDKQNTDEIKTDECLLSDMAVLKTEIRKFFSNQNLQGNPDSFFEYYCSTMNLNEFIKKYRILAHKWSDREYVDMPIVMYDDDAREQIESLLPRDLVDRIESELADSGCMQIKYSTYKQLSAYVDDDLL